MCIERMGRVLRGWGVCSERMGVYVERMGCVLRGWGVY